VHPPRAFAAAVAILAVAFGALGAEPLAISVTFADSADNLPQDEIRAAVARELEHRPTESVPISGELEIAVQGQQLFVRFHGARGYTGRVLPLPEERSQIPVILALAAGNLVRDQAAAVHAELPTEPAPKPVTAEDRAQDAALLSPAVLKPPPPAYGRHYFGLHFAQDFTVVSGENVCDASTGPDHGFYCFYPDSDRAFDHVVDSSPNADVDVWKKAGQSFVGINGGTFAAINKSVSLAADMNLLILFPTYAFVFEPSLGFVYAP